MIPIKTIAILVIESVPFVCIYHRLFIWILIFNCNRGACFMACLVTEILISIPICLVGTINTMNGEYYAHLHMSAADEDGTAVGGHLNSARISGTGELVITVTDGTVDRFKDEKETGLNLFSFPEGTRL